MNAQFDALRIVFFNGNYSSQNESFRLTTINLVATRNAFLSNRTTALYIHGYAENMASESVQTVVGAFLTRGTHNLLVLNWSAYANGSYVFNAVPNLIKVRKSRRD